MMKRVTVDLEHVKFSKREVEKKISDEPPRIHTKKIKLKKLKMKLVNKWTNSTRFVRREHNYFKLHQGKVEITPKKTFSSSNAVPRAPPDQLSVIPINSKVKFKGLSKTRGIMKKHGDCSSKSSGLLNNTLIERDGNLFQNAIKDLVNKIQNAKHTNGECILRKLADDLGEMFVMHLFIPIKDKSNNGKYINFMQLSMDMNHLFLMIEEKIMRLELFDLVEHLGELERLLNSGIVDCLSLDSVLESVLYPLFGLFATSRHYLPKVLSISKLKTKHRQEFIEQELNYTPPKPTLPIVILSDDEKTEKQQKPVPPDFLNSSEPLASQTTPLQAVDVHNLPADPLQIGSDDSDNGYLSGTIRKTKLNKSRGEFENYIRYLIDKYLDKHTAITSQKREKLDLVIKLASLKYPQQYHEVRKRIRNILRNTRRNNNRLMMRTLEEFGNSGSFPCSSNGSPDKLAIIGDLKNFDGQTLPPFTPFSQLQQQSPSGKPPYPSYSSTLEEPTATDTQSKSLGARFKIPYHYEVLQPSPLVSVEGDLARQFALYNYITSQKDSEGKHLCCHFFEIPYKRETQLDNDTTKAMKQPLDLKTIGIKINKISCYSSLSDLVSDLDLMLDNAIKLHQIRSFIGRDALRLKQLITSKTRELLKEDDVVDLTELVPSNEEFNQYYNRSKKRRQLMNFYQSLESYRDSNSRVLFFSFLLPPTGLKPPFSEKNFPTIMEIKQSLKKNRFLGLNSLAHSILYTLYAYLSVYPPNSQAFRDSEEMAKYVHTLYKEQTGETMLITRYTPKLYVLPGKKGHYSLALPTADFLSISYQTIHQCFTTVLATDQDMKALYTQGVGKKSVPITHLIPYKEVENLIKQKLKYIKTERSGTGAVESVAIAQDPVPQEPIPQEPITTQVTMSVQTLVPTPVQTPIITPVQRSIQTTVPAPVESENSTSVDTQVPAASKLKAYHFPSLMFRKYVLKRELCQFLCWSLKTFDTLFHSIVNLRPKKIEKEHLRKVYGVVEDYRQRFILIYYEDIKELESMGENFKSNDLISFLFKQNRFPTGVKLGSVACKDFLQFMDNKNETYFIIREIMNRMNVNLQDMVGTMEFKVMKLDAMHGLCWVGEWENIVQDIQKNPRYLESMVCLYSENLKLALAELESHDGSSRHALGRIIQNKFIQMKSSSSQPSNKPAPITISSGDEGKHKHKRRVSAPTEADHPVSVSDLADYLKWNKEQVETVFAKGLICNTAGPKLISNEYVNEVLTDIKYWENNCISEPPREPHENTSDENLTKLWNIPYKKEGHIILEDLGKYADIPIEVLETTYQVYIYVVKSDTDKRCLSLQGLDISRYNDKPIRLIEHSKIKWILDMKSKQENVNLGYRPVEKKIHTVTVPFKPEVELKNLSIKIAKTQVDPLMIFKYTALQMLTVDYKILTVQNQRNKVIKLKLIDTDGLKKPTKPIKIYDVYEKQVVLSHHLAEFTHIAPSNLFLFLLRYGVTYYSTNSKTIQLNREFERYRDALNWQGVPRYKNLTLYPLTEVWLLIKLREYGLCNVKLIEMYNIIQHTNQAILPIDSGNFINTRDKSYLNLKREIYTIEFKVHTVRDRESGKTIILKIYEDHYLFKPRDPIKVYQVVEGEASKRETNSLVLSHDLARYSNIPLTRLQSVLSSYTIPSFSKASSKPDIQANFNRYMKLLLKSGVPPYMKHTVLYPVKYLSSFLQLRELGFFNEKLLDVYKMIKFSPMQQKRILLTIRATAPKTGVKRPNEDESAERQEAKKPNITSALRSGKSRELDLIPKAQRSWKLLSVSPKKPAGIFKFPNIYRLSSKPGDWLLQTELVSFLGWSYEPMHKKLKSHELEIDSVSDLIEIMEQGGEPSSKRLFLVPKHVVNTAIEAKTKGKFISDIKKIFDKIEDDEDLERAIKLSRKTNVPYSSSNLLGSTFSDTDALAENASYKSADKTDTGISDYKTHILWRNDIPIKLNLPCSSSPEKQISAAPPEEVQMKNDGLTHFRTEELAVYLEIGSQELNIAFRGSRLDFHSESAYFVRATKDLQLFISLRKIGISKDEIWFVYFACKKITWERFEEKIHSENYVNENFKIGPHKTKLVIPERIKTREVVPRHISTVYNVPGYEESYYILEEVALQMEISYSKLLRTKDLVVFQNIKRDNSGAKDSLVLPFTLARVEDLQPLSLMHNIGIPGSVALEIFQQLRQLHDFNTWQVHDFTPICIQGYQPKVLDKWMSIDKRDGIILQHVATILGISPDLLEKKYERSSFRFKPNSIQHILLRAQRLSLPKEFDHLTFIPYSTLLYKDIGYLRQLYPKQITSLLSHNTETWTHKLFLELATARTRTETELCLKTVYFSGLTVKLISKQDLVFSNAIKLNVLPDGHEVVLASDLMRAFSNCELTDSSLFKLCECLGVKTSEPSIPVTRYIHLQRGDLTVEDIASMVLVSYNRNLQLVMLLLGLGADPCQLFKLASDADWSSFPESIAVLLTRPETLQDWLNEYLTERSNTDSQFFDLSQEYNYYIVDVTHPVLTNVKKSASNCEVYPYQLWKLNSTTTIYVSVNSLKNMFDFVLPSYLNTDKERLVSADSHEGKILLTQGYTFPDDKPQPFLSTMEVRDQTFREHCMYRLSVMTSQTLSALPGEDLCFHTICTQISRVKVISLRKHNMRIVLRKYVQPNRMQTQRYWASLDELMSYVPEEPSIIAIKTFLTDNKLLKLMSRSDKKYNPVAFVRWAYACQFAQLLEMGCSIDIDSMLELFLILIKQIEKVFRLSSPICCTLWIFLKEKPTVNGCKREARDEHICQTVESGTQAVDMEYSDELTGPYDAESLLNTSIEDLTAPLEVCKVISDLTVGMSRVDNETDPGKLAEN